MEGFFYSNIFETKGLEYILTIIFFALLIPFWLILNNRAAIKKGIQRALGVLSPARLNIPEGILHSQNHTWLYLFKSGTARVGADDLLMRIMGEVTIQPLKNLGEFVKLGEPI
ncbi:MAG: hypothetical protein Q8T08_17410, partial [Ignavibacteria bacterium]|nr:hypothetical protein [Ignavibacteria bacterium]